ncbi:MAG: HD domain-containing protein [Candidatus Eisenbacteria bacterium]
MSAELRQVFEFMIELDKLKAVLRRTKPVGLERYENPAEHSWQITLLALFLAEHARVPIDRLRVVEILLVHDIPEIDAGDQIVYEGRSSARYTAELQAARRIFGLLPEPHAAWCLERWMEYEARETHEAHFAYAVDRLMPLLQNLANDGQSWRENGVSLEKVLGVNAVMGDLLPSVWDQVKERLGEASALGFFGDPKSDAS